MGAGLSGISGQASPVKRRHGTNAAPGSGPGRASHCLVYQTPTAGAIDCAHDAWAQRCRPRALWKRCRTGLCLCLNLSTAAASPKGEQTASGPIVSTSYQTIIVLLDGSVGAERALNQATSLAQEC